MKTATVQLHSISPYSQSKAFTTARKDKEAPDEFEKRAWRDRIHTDDKGEVFIPPMALKGCLADAAAFLGQKIPGKRNATWTKHFLAGVLVMEGVPLGIKRDDVEGEWLYLNADGKKNSGTRVMRCMPVIREWSGEATFYVLDETITQDAFEYHLREAGNFIGIGRFRPRNGGFYGRFAVDKISWS